MSESLNKGLIYIDTVVGGHAKGCVVCTQYVTYSNQEMFFRQECYISDIIIVLHTFLQNNKVSVKQTTDHDIHVGLLWR